MLSECANSHSSAQFLYFGEGQLVAVPRHSKFPTQSRVEFFWLCGECAASFDLRVKDDGEVDVVERHQPQELAKR
jgi:hypothetical protein